MIDRRSLLTLPLLAWAVAPPAKAEQDGLDRDFAALERRARGRLGAAAWNLGTGRRHAWRGGERFRMCSTFKMLLAAQILRRAERGEERLDRVVTVAGAALPPHSPSTRAHLADGMSIADLCDAAITVSDNGAANLLLDAGGGPAALTDFLRGIGDGVTRTDRREPELNYGVPGDPRDTTTPSAILETWRLLLLDDALSGESRRRLTGWLVGNRTGDARLRAGLPREWRIGDKTGSDGRAITNDIAIAWPPGRQPVLVAAFLDGAEADDGARDAVIADVARLFVARGVI